MNDISVFWFRRDLRLDDNTGLFHALKSGLPVLTMFIFDSDILDRLEDKNDRRVDFIHIAISKLHEQLHDLKSSLLIKYGKPIDIWKEVISEFSVKKVFTNHDYEPYAKQRDSEVQNFLISKNITFHTFKDQVIFEKSEVMKNNSTPYVVFTPYSREWKKRLEPSHYSSFPTKKYYTNFLKITQFPIPSLERIGFDKTDLKAPSSTFNKDQIVQYFTKRDFPAENGTTRMSVHLRFGTISIRDLVSIAMQLSEQYVNELIWREFYQMILYHFPHVVDQEFKKEYQGIKWINDEDHFRVCRKYRLSHGRCRNAGIKQYRVYA